MIKCLGPALKYSRGKVKVEKKMKQEEEVDDVGAG